MIKDAHSCSDKMHAKLEKRWWHKVKALFFGEFSKAPESDLHLGLTMQPLAESVKRSSLKDWIKAVDGLQLLIQSMRSALEPMKIEAFDLASLSLNTYLFHIDRLLVKIREYILNYRYRQEQFLTQPDTLKRVEFLQVSEAAEQCYRRIVKLTDFVQTLPYKKLYSDKLTSEIQAFELETTTLGGAIRGMNQFCYRQEALLQLTQLEQNLLQSLSQTRLPLGTNYLNITGNYLNEETHSVCETMRAKNEYLRTKSQEALQAEQSQFVHNIIDIHEMLRKCYVVARKIMVKEALDSMAEGIENLIQAMMHSQPDLNEAFSALTHIFNAVESLRFSANRESRCSRNLFEKAKLARHQLRVICLKESIGQAFLKQIEVKRFSLVKQPK